VSYFVEHQGALVAQAWLYALAAPLMLVFAVSVRRILGKVDGFFSDIFVLGTTAIVGLQVVTYAMQIVFAQTAGRLPAEVVFTVGTHFQGSVSSPLACCHAGRATWRCWRWQ
jgi:hypothetical protein